MLGHLRSWRERGWTPVDASEYARIWERYGGSVATHPQVIERLSSLVGIPVRYLAVVRDGQAIAGLPAWGRHIALSRDVTKRKGLRGMFDLGNSEIILPVAADCIVPVRHRMRYISELNSGRIGNLRLQSEGLAMARRPEEYSKKFRYNQRREQRLLEEAGGLIRPISELTSQEQASIYADLFHKRWGFDVPGKDHLIEVFSLLREFMTGSVVYVADRPAAIQVLYRVEAPEWVSLEYVNGGVDPQFNELSPGSVLSFVNTQSQWEHADSLGKPLRYSFGRADREYKSRWCNTHPVYQI
ncbi:GNAT family N-acetyltransferase [Pseudomonas cichorii]|uniref:GNAT family N-acetyltransferase n=1 Tax=Pseudomonas cichorii TaxID=36746 RepID=UPI001C89ED8F|nr:GNAT family N-acetyltransferase [Pseudomonas cichorii]MBX8514633.1 antimicrobial resistance protein Mig-14 [Pseudomonas cichorii]MBX8530778.1 antimicrobial resistance protein Mig-14 [Pseudomonas cichorii]MBX8574232.1 antimicrobial resistance protein Mig-14 [Pseudomonas cichorii]